MRKVENVRISASVDSVPYPYTLHGDFMENFPKMEGGNHDLARQLKEELGDMRVKFLDFDPEYSQFYAYGKMKDLLYLVGIIARLEDEGWMQ